MNSNKIKAFTLVELIVVITILAILGTIAFIALQGYSKQARNSRRISDMQNIKTSLELYILKTGKYPLPDNSGLVTYSGELVWTQGSVGDKVTTNLSRTLSKKLLDPLYETEYTYSVTNSQKEYQVMGIFEGELALNINTNLLSITNASNNEYSVKVEGTYNDIFIKTPNYIIPTPSIITSEMLPLELKDGEKIKSMLITNGPNFPNINIQGTVIKTGGLDINLSVYTGSITSVSSDEEKIEAMNIIQGAYTGSIILGSYEIYKNLLDKTNDEDKLEFTNAIILKSNTSSTITQAQATNYTCDDTTKPIDNGYIIFSTGTPTEENQVYVQDAENCGYSCEVGYEYSELDNACMESVCNGSIPTNATSNATDQDYGTDWVYNTTAGICTFECNTNYTWSGSTCEADTQTLDCGGSIPSNATGTTITTYLQTWDGDSWEPTGVNWGEDQVLCDFDCNLNYTWNGSDSCTDQTPPVITSVTSSSPSCETIRFTINGASDAILLSGTPYSFDGGSSWISRNYKNYTGTSKTISANTIKVRDDAGNIYSYGSNKSGSSSACPVDCVGSWSDTSSCSVTCGGGVLQQVFTITTPAANGGESCSYSDGATRRGTTSCNTQDCPGTYYNPSKLGTSIMEYGPYSATKLQRCIEKGYSGYSSFELGDSWGPQAFYSTNTNSWSTTASAAGAGYEIIKLACSE